MRIQLALATTTALALALSACGSPAEEPADDTISVDEEQLDEARAASEAAAEGDLEESEEIALGEEEGADESAEPAEAAPTPSPTATPTQAAAAAAPAAPPQAFSTCAVCHSVEPGQNMIGPSLAGVFGRQAGSVAGATYSPAMRDANITWNEATLRNYIADPAAVVPGGTMPNPGVSAADAQAIVNYLKTL